MGLLVVFFLLKFLFASAESVENTGIEIQESDDPQLFSFIQKVADEVGTHFPKKVFLIPDVNSSSFWSLFFPTRKNLNIGLGLVNSLNSSEFKAVLAHEFGHFSQKSMRLGSYVYYVNQVIFNMLYRNNGWVSAAEGIASLHAIFYFMVRMAVYIVQFIQWVLRGMYSIINRQYLSLSREMEFHADAIAASVAGGNNAAQALRQVELGSLNYQQTLEKCTELLNTKIVLSNVYAGQRAAAAHFASENGLPLNHGLPVISQAFQESQQHTRVVFTNQWASHPTTEEREAKLRSLGLDVPVVDAPAWSVFQNPERWQRELTQYIYQEVPAPVSTEDDESFAKRIAADDNHHNYPKIFKHYYDQHLIADLNLDDLAQETTPKPLDETGFNALFSENLDQKIAAIASDIQTLKAIEAGDINTKTFDFEGQKLPKDQAPQIIEQLTQEKAEAEAKRDRNDQNAARAILAHTLAKNPGKMPELLAKYQTLLEVRAWRAACDEPCRSIFATIHYITQNEFNLANELVLPFQDLIYGHEPALRKFFETADLSVFSPETQEKIKLTIMEKPLEYKYQNTLVPSNLKQLYELVPEIGQTLHNIYFERMKALLELQETLIKG